MTRRRESEPVVRASQVAAAVIVLQLIVAALLVELHLPPVLQSLHQAVGTLLWIAVFTFAALARRAWDPLPATVAPVTVRRDHGVLPNGGTADTAVGALQAAVAARRPPVKVRFRRPIAAPRPEPHGLQGPAAAAAAATTHPRLARDLISLTKPRIISLLLVTTVAPMYLVEIPSWRHVLAVVIGGYLMAGGANAVNMYFDRDIDEFMARTRLAPDTEWPTGGACCAGVRRRAGGPRHLVARALRQRVDGRARGEWFLLLCPGVHALAQALHATQHCHRGRCRRLSAARWLRGGDRPAGPDSRLSLPDHLLLDPTALLGSRPPQAAGL